MKWWKWMMNWKRLRIQKSAGTCKSGALLYCIARTAGSSIHVLLWVKKYSQGLLCVGRSCWHEWALANRTGWWWLGGHWSCFGWFIVRRVIIFLFMNPAIRGKMYTCLFFTLYPVPPPSELCFRLLYFTTSVPPPSELCFRLLYCTTSVPSPSELCYRLLYCTTSVPPPSELCFRLLKSQVTSPQVALCDW
jgi:hypothetical protein